MASPACQSRSLSSLKSAFREAGRHRLHGRPYVTIQHGQGQRLPVPEKLPREFWSQLPPYLRPGPTPKRLRSYPPPPSAKSACAHPVSEIEASQIKALDPTGARTRLFDYKNPDGAKVGDTLLATFKTGDPFAGIILSIKSRGVDTSVLLRNQLTRIGTEMSIKIYSPSVLSMEIAARTEKRKRRARLYYMRKPKHDVGSVQRAVDQYLRKKAALTGGRLGAEYGQMRAKGKKR